MNSFIKGLPMAVLTVAVALVILNTAVKRAPVVGPLLGRGLQGV